MFERDGALTLIATFVVICAALFALLRPDLVTCQPEQPRRAKKEEDLVKERKMGDLGVLAHGEAQKKAISVPGLQVEQTKTMAKPRPSWQNQSSFGKAGPLFQTCPPPAINNACQGAKTMLGTSHSTTPTQQEANAWIKPRHLAYLEVHPQLDEKARSARFQPQERLDEGRYSLSAITPLPQGANERKARQHSMTTMYSAERFKEGTTERIATWHLTGQLGDGEPCAQPANRSAASRVGNNVWSTSLQEAPKTKPRPNWQTQVSFGRSGPMIQTSR